MRDHPPVHRRDDFARLRLAAARAAGHRIDALDADLPAAAEDVGGVADPGHVRRRAFRRRGAAVGEGERTIERRFDRDQPLDAAVDQNLEPDPARRRQLERIGDAPRIGGVGDRRRRDQRRGARQHGARIGRPRFGAQSRRVGVDEADVDSARLDRGIGEQRVEKSEIGPRPDDQRFAERGAQAAERRRAVGSVDDQLGDQRIVERRDFVVGLDAGVDAQRRRRVEPQRKDAAWARQEAGLRIFGVEARLDRRAVAADLGLLERQLFAGGDAELPLDQIEAR